MFPAERSRLVSSIIAISAPAPTPTDPGSRFGGGKGLLAIWSDALLAGCLRHAVWKSKLLASISLLLVSKSDFLVSISLLLVSKSVFLASISLLLVSKSDFLVSVSLLLVSKSDFLVADELASFSEDLSTLRRNPSLARREGPPTASLQL